MNIAELMIRRSRQTPSTGGVVVSGAGTSDANGVYTLEDPSATGGDRRWVMGSNYIQWQYGDFYLYCSSGSYCTSNGIAPTTDPWDTSLIWYTTGHPQGAEPAPTVTQG